MMKRRRSRTRWFTCLWGWRATATVRPRRRRIRRTSRRPNRADRHRGHGWAAFVSRLILEPEPHDVPIPPATPAAPSPGDGTPAATPASAADLTAPKASTSGAAGSTGRQASRPETQALMATSRLRLAGASGGRGGGPAERPQRRGAATVDRGGSAGQPIPAPDATSEPASSIATPPEPTADPAAEPAAEPAAMATAEPMPVAAPEPPGSDTGEPASP